MSLEPLSLPAEFDAASVDLTDRVVLVTGATGDVGSELSAALAARGATVILAGRKVPKLERLFDRIEAAGGPEPAIYPIDLAGAKPDDYADLANNVERELGGLHGVVHCALAFEALTPLEQYDPAQWMTELQVNLNAVFLLNQCLGPLLREADQGRIVFTLDDPGRMVRAYWGAYAVTKSALETLARVTAEELESAGVVVNAVRPPILRGHLLSRVYMAGSGPEARPVEATIPAFLYALAGPAELHGTVVSP